MYRDNIPTAQMPHSSGLVVLVRRKHLLLPQELLGNLQTILSQDEDFSWPSGLQIHAELGQVCTLSLVLSLKSRNS